MKKPILISLTIILYSHCFCQPLPSYNQYIKNLCGCFKKIPENKVTSMNDVTDVLGKCINLIDTTLRNKAMKEKNILKTDDESLIKFEEIFAIDLYKECTSFKLSIDTLINKTQNKIIIKLPILDTIEANICTCLELKGIPATKKIAVANIEVCMQSSILNKLSEVKKQYLINDDNQEILSTIGNEISKLVLLHCKFYLNKINPVLIAN